MMAREAYALSERFRAQGTTTVIGGLHATMLPDEAQQHCDAVVVGEGELSWPRLLADFEEGRLQHAPDENLRVWNLWYGIDLYAQLFTMPPV